MARTRQLTLLLAVAVAVSVVHYVDNVLNHDDFPVSPDVPAPSAAVIGVSWFVFTAAGLLGWWLYVRGDARRRGLALAFLLAYSLSGLVGLGHYTAAAMVDAPWWRQAHVLADIACGLLVVAFVLRERATARG